MNRRDLIKAGLLASGGGALLATAASRSAEDEYLGAMGFPYRAFDRLPNTEITVPGGAIRVAFAPGALSAPREAVFDWIRTAAKAVATYYGRFPVATVRLLIVPVPGARGRGGTTWGYRGAAIRVLLGEQADVDYLHNDWVMTHEMVHLALPDVGQSSAWLSEGLAVYVEPIARVQSGALTEEKIWADMSRDMPKGLPEDGDQGLDGNSSWGRIYWGGALFCLEADVELRKRTDNKRGLQDAMRGVLAAGGNQESSWPAWRVLEIADATVGLTVLSELYDKMRATPTAPELHGLMSDLGVIREGEKIRLDDAAPLAAIRKAITRTPQPG